MAQATLANRVMYDGLYTFVMRILNVAFAAALGILTARLLGPAGKGTYALPGVEAGLIATFLGGLTSSTSYYMLNRAAARSVLWPAAVTSVAFVFVGAVAVVIMAFAAHEQWTALPAILTLPASAAINVASGYAIGVKRVRYTTTISVALTAVTLLFMAIGLFLFARTATAAIAAWVAAMIVIGLAALCAIVVYSRRVEGNDHVGTVEFFRFSVKVGAVNLVSLLNYRADLYIVAVLLSNSALGLYTVAVSAAESLLVPTQVAALVVSPHIGSLERDAAARLAARCVRNNLLIAAIVCGALLLFAEPIILLLYGPAFLPVVPVLRVLLAGVFVMSLSSPLSSFFTLKQGAPEIAFTLALTSAAICIATTLVLVPHIGLLGAAAGSTAGYVVGQAAAFWVFKKRSGIGFSTMLLPTRDDMRQYWGFALRLVADGRARLRAGSAR
jgi:O-antigen/teichoic acid export membrane protein